MPKPRYNAVPYDGWAWYMGELKRRRRARAIRGIIWTIVLVAAVYVGIWLVVLALAGAAIKGQGRMTARMAAKGRE